MCGRDARSAARAARPVIAAAPPPGARQTAGIEPWRVASLLLAEIGLDAD
ncbi:hypothetical protein AB6V29_05850 [Microbacterium sp. 20-116]